MVMQERIFIDQGAWVQEAGKIEDKTPAHHRCKLSHMCQDMVEGVPGPGQPVQGDVTRGQHTKVGRENKT